MTTDRKTMKASEVIAAMQSMIQQHGDRNVFFSDGFGRFGVNVHAESAPNFDSPQAFLVKAFNLETGRNEPSVPLNYSGNTANNDLRGNVASMDKDMMGVARRTALEDAARELQKVAFDSAYDARTANHCVRVVLGLKHGGAAGQAFDQANPDSTVWDGMLAATPSPVPADTAELPPLPEPTIKGTVRNATLSICYTAPVHYTADQMRDYARAAIASRPAPVAEQKPVAVVDAGDDGMFAEILPDVSVKVGQMLYAAPVVPSGEVVVTWDEARTRIVAVTRQDEEGRVLSVIAHAAPAAPSAAQAAGVVMVPINPTTEMVEAAEQVGDLYRMGQPRIIESAIRAAIKAGAVPTPSEGVAAPVGPAVVEAGEMTAERAAFFMRRFKGEEKLLGPNEQKAVAYVLALLESQAAAAPAQPSAEQVRDAALAECEGICADIYRKHRDQYKGRGDYAPDNPRRADPHCDGCADGAAECEEAISKLRTASGEQTAAGFGGGARNKDGSFVIGTGGGGARNSDGSFVISTAGGGVPGARGGSGEKGAE